MRNFIGTSINKNLFNLVPGFGIYTGNKHSVFSLQVISYTENEHYVSDFKDIDDFLSSSIIEHIKKFDVNWINICGIDNVEAVRKFNSYFNISPMITEQVLDITNHTDSNINQNQIYANLQMIRTMKNDVVKEKLAIYKFDNLIITYQEEKGDIFDSLRQRISNKNGYIRERNADYLYYSLIDSILDFYIQVINFLEKDTLKFEEDLYNEKKLNVKKIFQIKKIISVFNHVIGPLSNHFNSLIDDDSFFFEEKKDFFNQLVSHLGSIKHDVGLLEDTVNTLTDLSLNITQYKMNKTVTVLTIFSAVFIPLSFLSGVFGMNFEYMPFIDNQYGFYFFIATSIVLVSIMLFFIKGTNDEK